MSKSVPRVLMMIDQFYPVVGGAEAQALRISMKLNEKGHKVLVLTRKGKEELADQESHRGIEINRLPILGVSGKSKLKSILPAVRWLVKNKNSYDIVHCHGVNPLEWSAYLASWITKKPYIVKIPLSNFLNYAGAKQGVKMESIENGRTLRNFIRPLMLPALKFVRKRLIKNASRVFAISPEISQSLKSGGFHNVSDIPNGIDTDYFKPVNDSEKLNLRKKLKLPSDEIIFVYSGRLSQEKNLMTLLKSWKHFTSENRLVKVRLILLGGGKHQSYTCEPELRKYADDNQLTSAVFQGAVENVLEFLQASDVFILPSFWEGMSNALLEAMACGLPSIVSDIPGNRALITHDLSGLLFETSSVIALSDSMATLAQDGSLRTNLGYHARKIADERYSLLVVSKNIIEQYYEILESRSRVR